MDPSICVIYGEECSAVCTDGQGVGSGEVVRSVIIEAAVGYVSLIPNSVNPGQITCKQHVELYHRKKLGCHSSGSVGGRGGIISIIIKL